MGNFKRGDNLSIDLGRATYGSDSIVPGRIVVSLLDHDGAALVVPEAAVTKAYPTFKPGLVIRITDGYLSEFVAMRTPEFWHFSMDRVAIWSDGDVLEAMEEHGYEVIYNPNEEGNDD